MLQPTFHIQVHIVIISNNHPIASLLVFYTHVTDFHSGRDLTLNLLRESYWIINAKSLIRKVLKSCLYSKRLRNQPKPPIMSDLPPERLSAFLPLFYFMELKNFFKLGFTPCKAEQPLRGMELQEKKHKKDYRIQKICSEKTYS